MNEFTLIERFFGAMAAAPSTSSAPSTSTITLGIGDDCAVLPVTGGELVVCKDVLLEGRHFFSTVEPAALGHKALAVNLSDIAAMGAKPIGFLLGLALPEVDEAWLALFSSGLNQLASRFSCPLIGGDTVRSSHGICISVTALGVAQPPFLERSRAQVGDDLWVSGWLGAPKVALDLLQQQHEGKALSSAEQQRLVATRHALEWPEPQLHLAQRLKPYVHAMIDVSDGLVQDLGHVLKASGVGACVNFARLPIHPAVMSMWHESEQRESECREAVQTAVLEGGDEYQLCFTAPMTARAALTQLATDIAQQPADPTQQDASQTQQAIGAAAPVITRIGTITADQQLLVLDAHQQPIHLSSFGYDHFRS